MVNVEIAVWMKIFVSLIVPTSKVLVEIVEFAYVSVEMVMGFVEMVIAEIMVFVEIVKVIAEMMVIVEMVIVQIVDIVMDIG